jgi:hypothetical protein
MIQALVEEMLFKLNTHECSPDCECEEARKVINILIALQNIRKVPNRPGAMKFTLPRSPQGASTDPPRGDSHSCQGKSRGA